MTWLIVIGFSCLWVVLIAIGLLWLSQAATASRRFDQTMADHFCPDELEIDQ